MNLIEFLNKKKQELTNTGQVKLAVMLKLKAKENKLVGLLLDNQTIKIAIHNPPIANQANIALIELIAKEFTVSKRSIRIVAGLKSKMKMLEICC